jgi:Arc/MetJ family transcription regulator
VADVKKSQVVLHAELPVRTDIEVDDQLMAKALRLTGVRTKRAVVEAALRALLEKRGRELLLGPPASTRGRVISSACAGARRGRPGDRRRQLGLDPPSAR